VIRTTTWHKCTTK